VILIPLAVTTCVLYCIGTLLLIFVSWLYVKRGGIIGVRYIPPPPLRLLARLALPFATVWVISYALAWWWLMSDFEFIRAFRQ